MKRAFPAPSQNRGGGEYSLTALYGKTRDNWNVTAAAEYFHEDDYTYANSEFTNACDEFRFEDEQGNILTQFRGLAPGTTDSNCRLNTINRVFVADRVFGNLWSTPGTTNIGVPNWSETIIGPRLAGFARPGTVTRIDINGDGELDDFLIDPDQNGISEIDLQTPFYNYDLSERRQQGQLSTGLERFTLFGLGSYNFEDANNTELYFEAMFARRKNKAFTPGSTIFPDVPPTNPFNITNPAGLGVNSLGFFGVNFGAFEATPIIPVRGDRDSQKVKVDLYRLVVGAQGNIGLLDRFLGGGWSYDAYVSHSRGSGSSERPGINEDRLTLSLETTIADPNNPGSYICGVDADGDGLPDGTDGCVPVNPFAPSLYQAGGGAFGSRAETEYLFTMSSFKTVVEQTIVNGSIQGDLFALPNGIAVPLLLGYEFRRDRVASIPNDVAANGTLYASFSDLGATGTRYLNELFTETSINLFEDQPYAEDLTFDFSGRLTDESSFKPHFTYTTKLLYRPLSWLTLRGTYGTSYRAPNPREQFLLGTSGFLTVTDPCVVPTRARESTNLRVPNAPEQYLPNRDTRTSRILDACRSQGLDPTTLGLETGAGDSFIARGSREIVRRGADDLKPETSRSYTLGFVVAQPFTDKFDLKLATSYFDIDLDNGIAAPSPGFILADCYNSLGGVSSFCSRVRRGADGSIDEFDATFLNTGQETVKGIDFDLNYEQDFDIRDERLNVQFDMNATWTMEQFFQVLDTSDDNVGEPSTPRWRADANLILDYKDLRFSWLTRWIKAGQNFTNASDFDEDATPCDGLPVSCRPVTYTKNYAMHTASLTYDWRNYSLNVGARNVFNTAPPEVDEDGVFSRGNTPLGIGYDLFGRTFYMNFVARL